MELENHELLRILGHRLLPIGETDLALTVFADVLELREEEPQSYRDLGMPMRGRANINKAIEHLYVVVERKWDDRFGNMV